MALDMTTALTINARVNGQQAISGLTKSFGQATTSANGLQRAFNSLKTAGSSVIGVLGGLGVGAAIKGALDTFSSFQAETKLLENGLKNVGAASGELEKLQKIASDLGEATLFNEEDFRKGFGLLTSFGNIGTENYERVAKAAADVAQTSGTDVSAAFMQLAKALNDPIKGLSALSRSGIQFTDAQKDMVEQLVETGQLAKAQTMIFEELEKQYQGNAEAAAVGLAGAFDTLGEKFYDLQVAIGPLIEKYLTPLVQGLTQAIDALAEAPEPVQAVVVGIAALAAGLVALAPLVAIISTIAPAFAAVVPAVTAVIGIVKALGAIVAAVIGGPTIGIIALVVAAGAAIFVFRDQIGDAFAAIGKMFVDLAKGFNDKILKPITDASKAVVRGIVDAFETLARALRGPFDAVGRFIKSVFNGYIGLVEKFINGAISGINKLVAGANRALSALKLPNIPTVSEVRLPRFAAGGVVDKPTVALVGEGREREYIVPESKMGRAALNYLMGKRGDAVLRNEGGRTGRAGASQGNTTIQLNTGPVLQQDGQRYVTIEDLERSLSSLAANLLGNSRSYAGRRYQGLA